MKRSRQLLAIGALLVSGALVLGGCGGGGGKDKRLTKAEFAAKANALCKSHAKEVEALGTPTTESELATKLDEYKALFERATAETKKLKPPSDEQAAFDRLLTIDDQMIGTVARMSTAVEKKDKAEYDKLVRNGDALAEEKNQLWSQLGATECAK